MAVGRQRGLVHGAIGVQVQAPANVVTVTRRGETQVGRLVGSVVKHVLSQLIELTEQGFGQSPGSGALGEAGSGYPRGFCCVQELNGGKGPSQPSVRGPIICWDLVASVVASVTLLGAVLKLLRTSVNV